MHEESLGTVIRDYLTGEELVETSYEQFRQALARMLAEEHGYPKEKLVPKVGVCIPVDGRQYTRMVDLVALGPDGTPLLLIIFSSGEPGSYLRESLAAARLYVPPVPLTLVTDTKTAYLAATSSGEVLGSGMRAIPHYSELPGLARTHPALALSAAHADRERRILYAYSEMLSGGCCQGACRPKARIKHL
ncbi:MAG: type I restriction enzyme HsdR N-terminal domain-containing protein [Defluviitaleaceae bacterium]|nr:type I restriction enzyme HsdR N-terminal domain-containing protein [Defluviitaleaceae bacterium]